MAPARAVAIEGAFTPVIVRARDHGAEARGAWAMLGAGLASLCAAAAVFSPPGAVDQPVGAPLSARADPFTPLPEYLARAVRARPPAATFSAPLPAAARSTPSRRARIDRPVNAGPRLSARLQQAGLRIRALTAFEKAAPKGYELPAGAYRVVSVSASGKHLAAQAGDVVLGTCDGRLAAGWRGYVLRVDAPETGCLAVVRSADFAAAKPPVGIGRA